MITHGRPPCRHSRTRPETVVLEALLEPLQLRLDLVVPDDDLVACPTTALNVSLERC